jgi:DNA polymerase eta
MFGTEQVSDLLKASLEQFRAKLNDDTATWLYGIIRGEDRSEVNPRTQIKSMLSAKSFRPSINNLDQAEKWLRIFAADIYGRLVEEGVLENKRRPKTAALHHRQGGQVRSRQLPIPGSATIDENLLFDLGTALLRQVSADGSAWPCANLSLSVGGFEDGVVKNKAIDGFLLRGEQAKSVDSHSRIHTTDDSTVQQLDEKRRKLEDTGLKRFFSRQSDPETTLFSGMDEPADETALSADQTMSNANPEEQEDPNAFSCPRCGKTLPDEEEEEHNDWHFAKDLEAQERQAARDNQTSQLSNRAAPSKSRGKSSRGGRGKPEKGQTRLTFG